MSSGLAWGSLWVILANVFNGVTNCLFVKAGHELGVFDLETLMEKA